MTKQIVIIGGGISGLSLLHFLRQKYRGDDSVEICLLEKNHRPGGTIKSIREDGCLFETGPNGFLDSKPRTLELIRGLGLDGSVVKADQESKIRYLSVHNKLHRLPSGPKEFFFFGLLNPLQKARVLAEPLVPKRNDPLESVYDFGRRRFGKRFAQMFLDPMVSGIFGGDARAANLKAVFPRIYELEQQYGSLFRAMRKLKKEKKTDGSGMAGPGGTLTSLAGGVEEIVEAIAARYAQSIRLNTDVKKILRDDHRYVVYSSDGGQVRADELYLCAPSYSAGPMIKDLDHRLANGLDRIRYAPIAVVGLVFPAGGFAPKPRGYGYLVPSSEHSKVLGVLFESNIFPGRCPDGHILFRVMIGGARHPDILDLSRKRLIAMAVEEIRRMLVRNGNSLPEPRNTFFIPWAKAIPQYDQYYCDIRAMIDEEIPSCPNMHLIANYLNGVSMNDCIENAYQGAQASAIVNV